jgi:hypothetical protein
MDNLITIEQLPIISEHLESLTAAIDCKINEALSMDISEENIKQAKKVRASLNKDFEALEERRKIVERQVLEPIDQFRAIYKQFATNKFKYADTVLKNSINEIEVKLKNKKRQELEEYFTELKQVYCLNFLEFDNCKLNITLTATLNALRKQVEVFVQDVSSCIQTILSMNNNAEILVEYKKTLDLNNSINAVNARRMQLEKERKSLEELNSKKEDNKIIVDKVNDALITVTTVEMSQSIIKCKFINIETGEIKSEKEYSYYAKIPLEIGDYVVVSGENSQNKKMVIAVVTAINVQPCEIGCDLSLLKTISLKYEKELAKQSSQPLMQDLKNVRLEITGTISQLRELREFLVTGNYEFKTIN